MRRIILVSFQYFMYRKYLKNEIVITVRGESINQEPFLECFIMVKTLISSSDMLAKEERCQV